MLFWAVHGSDARKAENSEPSPLLGDQVRVAVREHGHCAVVRRKFFRYGFKSR